MPPQSKGKGKSIKNDVEGPGVSWRDASLHGSVLILSMVKEAASLAPFVELKKAATVALFILRTIQGVRENKESYERLGEDAGGLIVVVWRSYKKAEIPDRWLSPEMREILEDLTKTLEDICSFVQEQLSRNRAIRIIFSKADIIKINEYREHLNYAMQKFELQSHMNINDVLMQLVRKNDELSEQIQHRNEEEDVIRRALEATALEAADREASRIHDEESKTEKAIAVLDRLKQVEIDNQARDERWRSDELKKIEKEAKDRQSELERLRAAASAVEIANRLKKAQEEEIAELRRKITASEDSTAIQVHSSKQKNSRQQTEVEDEEEWNGNIMVEAPSSEEEEEIRQPARKSSKVEINPSKSPNSGVLEYSQVNEEDSRSVRSSKTKAARRTPSLRTQETDDESTDEDSRSVKLSKTNTARRTPSIRVVETGDEEEYIPPPQRKNPKVSKASKAKTAPRKLSNPSIRVEETEDESSSEEEYYEPPLSRKNSKANRNSSGTRLREVDDLMSHIHGMNINLGNPYRSRPNSRPRSPMSTPMRTYGYGAGVPGTIVNSGVGNITNTTISNVGNDNSVRKVYHSPRGSGRR